MLALCAYPFVAPDAQRVLDAAGAPVPGFDARDWAARWLAAGPARASSRIAPAAKCEIVLMVLLLLALLFDKTDGDPGPLVAGKATQRAATCSGRSFPPAESAVPPTRPAGSVFPTPQVTALEQVI